jgi:WD repeat-containing protein 45
MNARQPIQTPETQAVLSVAFSSTRNRFIAGLDDGIRCFRTDNCFTTYHPLLPRGGGIGVAEAFDDRYIAFVGGGRSPAYKPNIFIWWDALLGKEVHRFDLHEPIRGLRLNGRRLIVLLEKRAVVFRWDELEASPEDERILKAKGVGLRGPNYALCIVPTGQNDRALASLRGDLLVLPSLTPGQCQLVPLKGGSKRVVPAAEHNLAWLTLSDDGSLLATASENGTLIRVWRTDTIEKIAQFRRGVEQARIYGLAFSPGNRWLACTSDKGTLHVFDLRPKDPAEVEKDAARERQHRKSQSYAGHRLSGTFGEQTSSLSGGGRSSPATASGSHQAAYHGSVQEYYGLLPPPTSASPPAGGPGVSALAALKASPFAPQALKDTKSVASVPFYMGEDPPHWQGDPSHTTTVGPDGKKRYVKMAVPPLPNNPTGRPPKGIVAFKPRPKKKDASGKSVGKHDQAVEEDEEENSASLWVISGGSDARMEYFDLLPATDGLGGYGLVKKGFRKYLTRQFPDD